MDSSDLEGTKENISNIERIRRTFSRSSSRSESAQRSDSVDSVDSVNSLLSPCNVSTPTSSSPVCATLDLLDTVRKDLVHKCNSDPGAVGKLNLDVKSTGTVSNASRPPRHRSTGSTLATRKCVLTLDGYSYVIGRSFLLLNSLQELGNWRN